MPDDKFRVVFRGMWHGYNTINHTHTMNAEEYADMMIEDEGNCIRSKAGCRSQWMTHETAIKLGLALVSAGLSGIERNHANLVFVLTPKRKTAKEVILKAEDRIRLRNGSIIINGKYRSLKHWTIAIRPNPELEEIKSGVASQSVLLRSALASLIHKARGQNSPALREAAEALYNTVEPSLT